MQPHRRTQRVACSASEQVQALGVNQGPVCAALAVVLPRRRSLRRPRDRIPGSNLAPTLRRCSECSWRIRSSAARPIASDRRERKVADAIVSSTTSGSAKRPPRGGAGSDPGRRLRGPAPAPSRENGGLWGIDPVEGRSVVRSSIRPGSGRPDAGGGRPQVGSRRGSRPQTSSDGKSRVGVALTVSPTGKPKGLRTPLRDTHVRLPRPSAGR